MREVREREVREVRGERRRNIWKKGRVDFKKKNKKTSLLFLVVGGWRSVYNGQKKKKKIVPAIKTIYIPIVKKLNLREEEENYKITKLQKSNHIGRRCITNINLCL